MTRSRKLAVATTVVVLVGVAAYTAYWYRLRNQLDDSFRHWVEARTRDGYTVSHGTPVWSGYPFEVRMTMDLPAMAPAGDHPDWSWSAERAALVVSPSKPDRPRLHVFGEQHLALGPDGADDHFAGHAETFTAEFAAGGWLPVMNVTIDKLALTDAAGEPLSIKRLDAVTRGDADPGAGPDDRGPYHIEANLTGVELPKSMLPLTKGLDHLALSAELSGHLASKPWPQSVAKWRDDGGTVQVFRIQFGIGEATIFGDATLALDGQGQPMGAGVLHITHHENLLQTLYDSNMIGSLAYSTVLAVMDGMTTSDASGNKIVDVPISVQDRVFRVASIGLFRMPKVHWLPDENAGS